MTVFTSHEYWIKQWNSYF